MDYSLALQLKEAGFIFNSKRKLLTEAKYLGGYKKVYAPSKDGMLSADYELEPSLSELIEACGDGFASLFYKSYNKIYKWETNCDLFDGDCGEGIGKGKTPEEAVANLWLKLNQFKN